MCPYCPVLNIVCPLSSLPCILSSIECSVSMLTMYLSSTAIQCVQLTMYIVQYGNIFCPVLIVSILPRSVQLRLITQLVTPQLRQTFKVISIESIQRSWRSACHSPKLQRGYLGAHSAAVRPFGNQILQSELQPKHANWNQTLKSTKNLNFKFVYVLRRKE